MNLTKPQLNILRTAIEETLITKGENKGRIKGLLDQDCYDGRTTSALARKGLLGFHVNTIYGSGWAATEQALAIDKASLKPKQINKLPG